MDHNEKASHRDDQEAESAPFDPFAFDILPDSCTNHLAGPPAKQTTLAQTKTVAPAKIPGSIARAGNNGNNSPANLQEEMYAILDQKRSGRVSLFTPERAAVAIEGIEDGLTMEEIAAEIGVTRKTIWTWMQLCPGFGDAVAQAREYQGHAIADNAVKILDNVTIDENNPKAAMAELRKAEQRARIRMELAKCFNFKQYGDKKQNMNLNVNADVSPVDLSKYT